MIVRLAAIFGAGAGKQLGAAGHLGMDFHADDDFPIARRAVTSLEGTAVATFMADLDGWFANARRTYRPKSERRKRPRVARHCEKGSTSGTPSPSKSRTFRGRERHRVGEGDRGDHGGP